jgi:DNA-nicking Smr family endonuclease
MSAFDQLKVLRDQLHAQQVEADNRVRRAAVEAAKRAAEANLFRKEVKDALPLPDAGRAAVSRAKPLPHPHQRERDEAQVLIDALSDEFGVEQLLETDDQLSWRRGGIGPEVLTKLRRGFWTIQSQLDLHGARTDEARELLSEFLREACKRGLRCVRVVHGKGLGSKDRQPVLKGKVRSWLIQKEQVIAFVAARPAEGGGGALIVLLRPQTV